MHVHYQGMVCTYSGLPACENCPFKAEGTVELSPTQDESLRSGSSYVNPDGTVVRTGGTRMCPHNVDFFLKPNYQDILNQQMAEMAARAAGQ